MTKRKPPLPMAPAGLAGRLFGFLMERMNRPAYDLTLSLVDPQAGQAILEVGFGTGKLLEMFSQAAPRLHLAGVEPTETMLDVANARKRLRERAGVLDLRLGTADALPWREDMFDTVAALHCFQFWPEPGRALREIRRVLKPGGGLVMVFRDHGKHAPDFLPNPVSKSGDEVGGAMALLRTTGFAKVAAAGAAGSSAAVTAEAAAGA
ncbi:MAG: class I SAM-dependent methyltransferase [Pseudomonadota bacterium]